MEYLNLEEELKNITNYNVVKYLMVTKKKIEEYDSIAVSVSGGSDSDIILDMFARLDKDKKVKYVWFDTGLEYKATKEHLKYLEKKYDIKIEKIRGKKLIPQCCKEYGQPFLSKDMSSKLNCLQNNNFDFKNDGLKEYEALALKYPKCTSVLKWWCNTKKSFNIKNSKFLKEFLIEYPPNFKISSRCCNFTKKDPVKKYLKENKIQLDVQGARKAEGGIRATSYKSCFDNEGENYDRYRPLFFFTDEDKKYYKEHFGIIYSDCYEVWRFKRTGCAGCPYNSNHQGDLTKLYKYEPNIYKACNHIFKDSYEYTKKYNEFKDKNKSLKKEQLL